MASLFHVPYFVLRFCSFIFPSRCSTKKQSFNMHLGVVSSVPLEVDTGHKLNHLSEIQPSQTSEESANAFTPLSMEFPSDKFHEVSIKSLLNCFKLNNNQVVRGPLNYLLSAPGKDFRRQLISAFNQSLQVPADKLEVINHIVELLHTASLLYDQTCLNSAQGTDSSLIIGSMIFKTIQNSDEAFLLPTKYTGFRKQLIQQTMPTFWPSKS